MSFGIIHSFACGLNQQSNWASRMSRSKDAEQTGNDVDSDFATDDQQGGSYWEVVGRRKRRKKNSKQYAAFAIPVLITARQPRLEE